MIKKSFTLRILVISFLLFALPLLIGSFIFFEESYDNEISSAKKELKGITDLRSVTMLAVQPVKKVLLNELIYLLDLPQQIDELDQDKLSQELVRVVHTESGSQIFVLTIEKPGGYKIIASSDHLLLNKYFKSYQQIENVIAKGEASFVRYTYSENEQTYIPNLFVAQLVKSKKTGQPIGVIVATTNISDQLNIILKKKPVLKDVQFAIVNGDGVVFAATDEDLKGQYFNPLTQERKKEISTSGQLGAIALAKQPLQLVRSDPPYFEFIDQKKVQIAYKVDIPLLDLSIIGYLSKKAFFAAALQRFSLIYILYGLVLIFGSAVTYWLSLWISRPLRQLSTLMGKVSQGNLDVHFKPQPFGFEINILGKLFNQTLITLLENIKNAENERIKKQTYERELAIGHQVQRELLPHYTPSISGAQIAALYLPAREVGGDIYNYLTKETSQGEETLILPLIDVEGQGIPACLYSLSVQSLFRSYAMLLEDVGEILKAVNNDFIKEVGYLDRVLKIFAGVYFTHSRVFTYYSCGAIFGLVKRKLGEIIPLKYSKISLGQKEESTAYQAESIQLQSGDTLLIYNKGLLSALNPENPHDLQRGLESILPTEVWESAPQLVESLIAQIKLLNHFQSQENEIIVIALSVD